MIANWWCLVLCFDFTHSPCAVGVCLKGYWFLLNCFCLIYIVWHVLNYSNYVEACNWLPRVKDLIHTCVYSAWKKYEYGVFCGLHFYVFGQDRISYSDTFHKMIIYKITCNCLKHLKTLAHTWCLNLTKGWTNGCHN